MNNINLNKNRMIWVREYRKNTIHIYFCCWATMFFVYNLARDERKKNTFFYPFIYLTTLYNKAIKYIKREHCRNKN